MLKFCASIVRNLMDSISLAMPFKAADRCRTFLVHVVVQLHGSLQVN